MKKNLIVKLYVSIENIEKGQKNQIFQLFLNRALFLKRGYFQVTVKFEFFSLLSNPFVEFFELL